MASLEKHLDELTRDVQEIDKDVARIQTGVAFIKWQLGILNTGFACYVVLRLFNVSLT